MGKGVQLMWTYNRNLQFPIDIKNTNPKLAKVIISQYGGPDGELGASLGYLSQRFGMPDKKSKAILNDIGTEELAHLEMVGTLVHRLTDGATAREMEEAGGVVSQVRHERGRDTRDVRVRLERVQLNPKVLQAWRR